MTLIDIRAFPTSLALAQNMGILNNEFGFRVLAFAAENEFVDEYIEEVLQFLFVVGTVDDVALGGSFADDFGLGTEFEAEEFGYVDGWTGEIVGDVGHVGDDCLDTVSFSFDLKKLVEVQRRKVRGGGGMFTFDCTGCILYR